MDDSVAAAFLAQMAGAPIGEPGVWFQVAVADKATDALVGDIGICVGANDPAAAEIGFTMAPAAQRRGLGTDAVRCAIALLFESGVVASVEGISDARNTPSIGLLERMGMSVARIQVVEFKGEQCTEIVYVVMRTHWDRRDG
jgi:aminoglycoside 6'-N-acetyltransferase